MPVMGNKILTNRQKNPKSFNPRMNFYFHDLQDLPSSNRMKYSLKKMRIALENKQKRKKTITTRLVCLCASPNIQEKWTKLYYLENNYTIALIVISIIL